MEITLTKSFRLDKNGTHIAFIGQINPNTTSTFRLLYSPDDGYLRAELKNEDVTEICKETLASNKGRLGGWGDITRNWDQFIRFLRYLIQNPTIKGILKDYEMEWLEDALRQSI